MRYSQTHKAETHAKLVKLAGRFLREKGPEKLAVDELMHGVGLTHGGFYAHFKSKDALLAEALEGIFEEARQRCRRIGDGLPPLLGIYPFGHAALSFPCFAMHLHC